MVVLLVMIQSCPPWSPPSVLVQARTGGETWITMKMGKTAAATRRRTKVRPAPLRPPTYLPPAPLTWKVRAKSCRSSFCLG